MTPRATLIYDGDCAFCRRWVAWLRRWDRHRRLAYVPLQSPATERFGIPATALRQAMHFVRDDGQVARGAAAAPLVLKLLPAGWLLRWLFALPAALVVADAVYRWVARRRHRFGCGSTVCRRAVDPDAVDA